MKTNDQTITEDFAMYNDDCCERIRDIPSNSVGASCYSIPFSNLYTFSASERDMGNCKDDAEFFAHYSFLVGELLRVTKPGRLCAVHCKDLVDYKNTSGRSGLRDFPGDIIRAHSAGGWKFHSRITVWKNPVVEMQRTKSQGLLYKQLRADSTLSRVAAADYVLLFRKWESEGDVLEPVSHNAEEFTLEQWENWASPVWMDINQTDVLNVKVAKTNKDERHITPLQLDLIERIVLMYSNPGDVVCDPFAGIGSTGVVALKKGRRFLGIELKDSYYKTGVRNLKDACAQTSIFDRIVSP